jgi:hypothetical protein
MVVCLIKFHENVQGGQPVKRKARSGTVSVIQDYFVNMTLGLK